jgi:succinate dehydrogenase/fumarate reductase flavoprotein subunit
VVEEKIETDVLVVGGGGAGFRAAMGVREAGAKAVLLSKGPLARCGASPMAGADFTLDGKSLSQLGFPGAPNDTEEKFFNDIVTQGYFLNNQKLIEQYIRKAPDRLKELLDWGIKVIFSEERAIFTSGLGLMDALLRQARKMGVVLLEDTMLIDLLTHEGKIVGGLGFDIRTGQFIHFQAQAVIMATGGWHKAFWPNTGMRDLSGEGIAMAHRAGADIGNMEFITFCCNVLYSPPVWRGSIATYILGLLCGGELTNSQGEAFLKKYDPFVVDKGTTMEWNKGFLSFASSREVRDGKGSSNGGVYYGLGQVPWETYEKIATSTIFPNWKYKAMDLVELARMLKAWEPVEVGPAVEYFDGGILVNENFETNLEGLYAAGECALGPFGANRVCSAITEMLVHGADAGQNAGGYAKKCKGHSIDSREFIALRQKAEQPFTRKEGINPAQARRRIQELAHKHLGPIRNAQELKEFLALLERAEKNEIPNLAIAFKNRVYNKEWLDALELPSMVHLLKAAAKSALYRTESRGVHFREDYPLTDNENWLRESMVKYDGGGFRVSSRPVTVTSMTPPQGKTPFLGMMKQMMASRSDIGGHH